VWFKYFDVQAFSAPTVVFYNPQTHRHDHTIGKFDKKEITWNEKRFSRGRMGLRDTQTLQEDI